MKWGYNSIILLRFSPAVTFCVSLQMCWVLMRWSGKIRGIWGRAFPHCICILEYNKTLKWAVLGNWAFWMVFVSFLAVSCHSVLLLACARSNSHASFLATSLVVFGTVALSSSKLCVKLRYVSCEGRASSMTPAHGFWLIRAFWGLFGGFR